VGGKNEFFAGGGEALGITLGKNVGGVPNYNLAVFVC